jgi:hypothetical protein
VALDVLEEFHGSTPVRIVVRETPDPESIFTFTKNVHAAVLEPFDLDDPGGYPNPMNRVFRFRFGTGSQKNDPERLIVINAVVDHEPVAFFEDMEGNHDVGKQDEIRQRKERNLHGI